MGKDEILAAVITSMRIGISAIGELLPIEENQAFVPVPPRCYNQIETQYHWDPNLGLRPPGDTY